MGLQMMAVGLCTNLGCFEKVWTIPVDIRAVLEDIRQEGTEEEIEEERKFYKKLRNSRYPEYCSRQCEVRNQQKVARDAKIKYTPLVKTQKNISDMDF